MAADIHAAPAAAPQGMAMGPGLMALRPAAAAAAAPIASGDLSAERTPIRRSSTPPMLHSDGHTPQSAPEPRCHQRHDSADTLSQNSVQRSVTAHTLFFDILREVR